MRTAGTLVRKLDRASLLGWADSQAVGDNAEETDDAPLPLAILPRILDLSRLVPSSAHGGGPRRAEVSTGGRRYLPLRC